MIPNGSPRIIRKKLIISRLRIFFFSTCTTIEPLNVGILRFEVAEVEGVEGVEGY